MQTREEDLEDGGQGHDAEPLAGVVHKEQPTPNTMPTGDGEQ